MQLENKPWFGTSINQRENVYRCLRVWIEFSFTPFYATYPSSHSFFFLPYPPFTSPLSLLSFPSFKVMKLVLVSRNSLRHTRLCSLHFYFFFFLFRRFFLVYFYDLLFFFKMKEKLFIYVFFLRRTFPLPPLYFPSSLFFFFFLPRSLSFGRKLNVKVIN